MVESLVLFIKSFSDAFFSRQLRPHENVDIVNVLPIGGNYKVAFLHRRSLRRWKDPIPCESGGFRLLAVFADKSLTETVYFRWSERSAFWCVKHSGRTRVVSLVNDGDAVVTLTVPTWQVLVFARSCGIMRMNELLKTGLGGQRKMKCRFHHRFLVKKPVSCSAVCSVRNCTRSARWLCQASNPVLCLNGVFQAHGGDLQKKSGISYIRRGMMGHSLRVLPARQAPPEDREGEFASSSESDDDELEDDRVWAPLGLAGMNEAYDCPPVHSRRDLIPIYDVNQRYLSGHYLWNQKYNVMPHRWNKV